MPITIESPLQLRKRFRALRSPTLGEWVKGLQEGADETLKTLRNLQGTQPQKLVGFYRVVSPWCDMGAELRQLERDLSRIDYGQYTKARTALLDIAAQDERCTHGINRTSPGQKPSVHTTFLGERCQLSTETVSYWESVREDLGSKPALIGRSDSPTVRQVIDAQASIYLNQGLARWKPILQALIDS